MNFLIRCISNSHPISYSCFKRRWCKIKPKQPIDDDDNDTEREKEKKIVHRFRQICKCHSAILSTPLARMSTNECAFMYACQLFVELNWLHRLYSHAISLNLTRSIGRLISFDRVLSYPTSFPIPSSDSLSNINTLFAIRLPRNSTLSVAFLCPSPRF